MAMQPIGDVAYKLSDLVKRIILYKSPALTFFEQHSYSMQCSMYKPSYIYMANNIDYVLILSVSRSPSYCTNRRILSSGVLYIIL